MTVKIIELIDKTSNPALFISTSICIVLSFLSAVKMIRNDDKGKRKGYRNNALLFAGVALVMLMIIAFRISENV